MNLEKGYVRVKTISPYIRVGNIAKNLESIKKYIIDNSGKTDILVFPELCVTGYTCGDLFLNPDFIKDSMEGILDLQNFLLEDDAPNIIVILGAPYGSTRGKLYNAAYVLGKFPGPLVIPKKNLPNYSEFYEKRWFDTPLDEPEDSSMGFCFVPDGVFSVNTKFTDGNRLVVGVELCEDLWAVSTPSTDMVLKYGAELIINISASPRIIGKSEYVKDLIKMTSARLCCAYVYCSVGPSESTTDLVFSGLSVIYENGVLLSESDYVMYQDQVTFTVADVDVEALCGWRRKNKTITSVMSPEIPEDCIDINNPESFGYTGEVERVFNPHPFMPIDTESGFREIINIMSLGVQTRFESTGCKVAVLGLSGGSDSTLALLTLVEAFKAVDRPLTDIHAISMPCFGTTDRTKGNARKLAESLGVTFKEISIKNQVTSHLISLGHPLDVYDIAYENAQARARTMLLFDYSNMVGGMVIGTGDLSELALGWCTYGADHLSSYNPNVSVPKSLVIPIIWWFSDLYRKSSIGKKVSEVLDDIAGTPISPELIPGGKQFSEDTVGPYEVMDFFLYHFVRSEWGIERILWASGKAFDGKYTLDFLKERLLVFLKRFRSQQFKRSCLPDGPKIGSVSLSPRGDWRMPSDMSFDTLINKIENYDTTRSYL